MIVDIIYCLFILIAFIHGFKKGIIHSIVSLLAFIIGILAAVHFSEIAAIYLNKWFHFQSKYIPLISFILLFIVVFLCFRIIEKLLEGFFKIIQLNFINKIAGGIVWVIVITFIFSTVLFYLNKIEFISSQTKIESFVYSRIEPLANETTKIIGVIIPPVKNIFNDLSDWFDEQEVKSHSKENNPA